MVRKRQGGEPFDGAFVGSMSATGAITAGDVFITNGNYLIAGSTASPLTLRAVNANVSSSVPMFRLENDRAMSAGDRFFELKEAFGGTAILHVDKEGDTRITGSLGVGNSAAGTVLGSVTKKIQIFDSAGASLGFLPVYDAIT